MSLTLKNVSQSLKKVTNILKNDNLTIFILFLTFVLSVGYLVNKNYHALVIMYLIAGLMFLLCKNLTLFKLESF